MPDQRYRLSKLEFYITNVCNLGCNNCNRFNNLNFRGHSIWSDYADAVSFWAEKIDVDHIVIMGGEPLLNPTINDWIVGLSKAWGKSVQVMSNGTRINQVPGLYSALKKANNSFIGISLHYPELQEQVYQRIRDFFPEEIYEKDGAENTVLGGIKSFQDYDSIHVEVWQGSDFNEGSLIIKKDGRLTLHNNKPEEAFRDCTFQQFKNYHWIDGKLYRCGPVGLFPKLDDQFDLDLSPEDKILLRAYEPLGVDNFETKHQEFFSTIDDMIPQCKFCVKSPGPVKLSLDNDLKNARKIIAKG